MKTTNVKTSEKAHTINRGQIRERRRTEKVENDQSNKHKHEQESDKPPNNHLSKKNLAVEQYVCKEVEQE